MENTVDARLLLPELDHRAYAALRRQQAEECPSISSDLKQELAAFSNGSDVVISRHLANGTFVWGAFDSWLLVGAVAVTQRQSIRVPSHLWMWGLYVLPRYRGTPVSRMLMTAALTWCEQQPPEQRLLGGFEVSNLHAAHFCERYGFQQPDESTDIMDLIRPTDCTLVERARGIGL